MAHEIETMAYYGAVPWHGLGVRIPEHVRFQPQEMLEAAGLDWQVGLVQLATADTREVVDRFGVRRLSDGRILGTVGSHYRPLQNADAFAWFAPFLESREASLHTAGALRGGSRVWVLAKLNRDPLVVRGDDTVEKYLLLSHGHDGTLAVRCGFTPIRVVCNNTLSMAVSDGRSALIRLRHTDSLKTNLSAIRETINTVDAAFEATADQYRLLAHKDIHQGDVLRYVRIVFSLPDELTVRARHMVQEIERAVESGLGNAAPGVRGTWWAAYNGVTEFLAYKRGRTTDSRINSLWFGEAADLNKWALDTAVEMAVA
jgi:phage/plasmid-like protein (TIGR03299 family)